METLRKQLDDCLASDEALVERARRGSGSAFAALVTRHRDAVYVIARNMSATAREGEQMLQQTFLEAWRELYFFPAGATFTTWLYRLAIKTALARGKRPRKNAARSMEAYLPVFDRNGKLPASKGRWDTLESSFSGMIELSGLLRGALDCVDDQARATFVLRDLLQLPPDEVAAILRTSPDVVQKDAHRLRLMLRGFIDQL